MVELFVGIDPGLRSLGYSGILRDREVLSLIFIGSLSIANTQKQALWGVYDFFDGFLVQWLGAYEGKVKGFFCLETQFVAKNVVSAFNLAQVRAVFMVLAGKFRFEYIEKSPTEIKKIATGSGASGKEGVAIAVGNFFNNVDFRNEDESDSLAIAFASAIKQ